MKKKICKFCKSEIDKDAKRCPKCQGDLRSWVNRHPILSLLLVLFFGSILIISVSGSSSNNTAKQESNNTQTPEAISDEYLNSLAESFCKNRSDGKPYFDLQPVAKILGENVDKEELVHNTAKTPSADDCKKVATICVSIWDKEDCEKIANKEIWIGMSEVQLNLSWGNPNDKNNTTGAWGIHSQWVYGDPIYNANYVYLEGKDKDSMIVTSWQD